MDTIIKNYLEQIKVGRKQSYKNLSLYPLLSAYSLDLEYLLLDEALTQGLMEVVELDSDGSVPELKVVNKSPEMILILDGEELVGAKQNRIVNTTILVQRNTTIVIPVSCVEHGRWSDDSTRFSTQERMMSSNLRARKSEQVNYSVRSTGEFRADQGHLAPLGESLAFLIPEAVFRSGNAPGADEAFAIGVCRTRPSGMQYVVPYASHRVKTRDKGAGGVVSLGQVPDSEISSIMEKTIQASPDYAGLVKLYLSHGKWDRHTIKLRYLFRDTLKGCRFPRTRYAAGHLRNILCK